MLANLLLSNLTIRVIRCLRVAGSGMNLHFRLTPRLHLDLISALPRAGS